MSVPYDYDQTNIEHLRAVVSEQEAAIEYLRECCKEGEVENAKLRELVRDMLPFAEVGFEDTCPTRRCCLFDECDVMSDCKCRVEEHMSQRLHDLGVEVDGC